MQFKEADPFLRHCSKRLPQKYDKHYGDALRSV